MRNYFAENLRFIRKRRKLTQGDIADALGVSKALISAWENGTRKPTVDGLKAVCNITGYSMEEMYFTKFY